jgi:hypothetical protein
MYSQQILETIELMVDVETARAFESATNEEKQKLRTLLGIWLRQPVRAKSSGGSGIQEDTVMEERETRRFGESD